MAWEIERNLTLISFCPQDETVSEELTPGAIVSGDLDTSLDDSESADASYFVQRMVMEPRFTRLVEGADAEDDEDENGMAGMARVGELGTIISVIKIATELGEAVLPVVIKEVETSPIGNLVIGIIGGINDGASGASIDTISSAIPIPIKVARRAVRGFLKTHAVNN